MAHVISPDRESVETRRERAQLLIVIGLVFAITLVSLALFLNSIIYAENVGARGADVGGSDATSFVNTVESEGETLVRTANDEEETFADQNATLRENLADWNEQSRLLYTSGGVYSNVEHAGATEGTQIVQDVDREFTNKDNATLVSPSSWRVAEDVAARDFVLNVSGDGLSSDEDAAFRLSVTEGLLDDGQNLTIYEEGGNITIVDQSGDECNTSDDRAVLDFASSTLNGNECEMTVFDGVDSYDIWYVNGHRIEGQYRLIVNESDHDPGSGLLSGGYYHDDPADGSPYAIDAIWSAEVGVTYETSRLDYRSTIEIVPGEIDD